MLYDNLCKQYDKGEPIFLYEISDYSNDYIRQEMKRLTDCGKLERVYNGVYILPYITILGTKGRMSIDKYIDKKYLRCNNRISGYYTGLQLANLYGFTTQNPSCIEIRTNAATTVRRTLDIDGHKIVVYRPYAQIDETNESALMFLDLMTDIDKYTELSGEELKCKLRNFANQINVDFNKVKEYISLYPCKVYKNIYEGGMMNELV